MGNGKLGKLLANKKKIKNSNHSFKTSLTFIPHYQPLFLGQQKLLQTEQIKITHLGRIIF